MKTVIVTALAALALSALVAAPSVIAQQRDEAAASGSDAKKDAQAACMAMMQGSGTEEGKKAMQEFMRSPKAPQAMMEMMGGGMGGMMGGQASPGMQRQKY